MNISYDVTLADLVAFNLYHSRHSPAIRRQLLIGRIFISFITAALILVVLFLLPHDGASPNTSAYIVASIGGVAMFLMHPWLMRISIRRLVTKMAREGKNVGMLGTQRMELSSEGVVAESKAGSSTIAWSAIERIAETEDRAFFYVNAMNALVLPVAAFADRAQYEAFIRAARQFQQGAATPSEHL